MNETDYMEMPCLCDCGCWFDLNDGYAESGSNKIVCKDCHLIDKNHEERKEEIYSIGTDLDEGHITFSQAKTLLKSQEFDTSKFKTKAALIKRCTEY